MRWQQSGVPHFAACEIKREAASWRMPVIIIAIARRRASENAACAA